VAVGKPVLDTEMETHMRHVALLGLLALAACDGDKPVPADTATEPAPVPGDLQAGFARVAIPAPVGMGTVGYGPMGGPDTESRYTEIYPATQSIHGVPEVKVAVLSRGDAFEVIFARFDAVGVFQQFRRAVVLRVMERSGRDIDRALVMGGTHTHGGSGRIVDGGAIFDIIADSFFPEYYDVFVNSVVDVILAAYDDLAPARIGVGEGYCADGHDDRRCEDGAPDYENGYLPLLGVERDGELEVLITAYAVHGTVLSLDDLTLSQDVHGAIEQAIEDRFDHPVEVMAFNAWGADMSPGNPDVETQDGATQPDGFDRMERVGVAVADEVHAALAGGLEWTDTPDIELAIFRPRIDREVIGYEEGVFPYNYGAVYCEGDDDCNAATTIDGLDTRCIPFNEMYPAPNQTVMTAGHVGGFHLVTFPGEPGTTLAEALLADIRAAHDDVGPIFFMGYGQDYNGYSIAEEDWWQGGYEASGSLWGPKQGEYLSARALEAMASFHTGRAMANEADFITPFDDPTYTPLTPETAVDAGSILVDVEAAYTPTDTVTLVVAGSDPWLGPPAVSLVDASGAVFLRPNGTELTGDDYHFHRSLVVDPLYEDVEAPTTRTFAWTISMPARHQIAGWFSVPAGAYTLRVQVPLNDGTTATVESAAFTLGE
jgi:hypothetical protein